MLSLNIHQLKVFLEAAETLNFTIAANHLQLTQPSVSQNIQALEELLGIPLFSRIGRNIELTDAGNTLVPMAREMIYLSTHIEETMASQSGDIHGHILVGCSTASGRYLLPRLLSAFHHHYPAVKVTCQFLSHAQALELLIENRIHLAVLANPKRLPELELMKFARDPLELIAPYSHPWASARVIDPNSLFEADFILPVEGSEIFQQIQESFALLDLSIYQLKTILTLGSPEAIALSVQEGLGVGFVPGLLRERLVQEKVTVIDVNGLNMYQDLYLARNPQHPPTFAQAALWDMVREAFSAEPVSVNRYVENSAVNPANKLRSK